MQNPKFLSEIREDRVDNSKNIEYLFNESEKY